MQRGDASAMMHVHGVLCGLKAICTRLCTDGIEECRKCCGGQGYLLASGVCLPVSVSVSVSVSIWVSLWY